MSSLNAQLGMSGYDAANPTRRVVKTWSARLGNSDTDDLPSLDTLRSESRDAYRNQPLVRGAIDTKRYNTIGSGLALQSQPNHDVIGISEEQAALWAKDTEFKFIRLWSENKNCDAERTKYFDSIQDVAFSSTLLSGDICALLPHIDRGSLFSLTVQLIEADRLSNPNNAMDDEKTAGGITVGKYGDPETYHFNKYHPGGLSYLNEWVSVPAYGKESGRPNVIHLAEYLRPGQRRGVPILAPVLESLKVLSEYTTAELEAALVSGLFTTFVKTETGELPDPLPSDVDDDNDDRTMQLAPGLIVGLKPGEDIETANPGRPNQAFDAFVMSIIKQIGAALQVPYELLIKHFSSSYSASRAALLEAYKAFKTRRIWFAKNFCQPIYEEWLYEAVITGVITAPGFLESETIRRAYGVAAWIGPAPGQLDPGKETSAALARVEAGFSTRTEETMMMNTGDFETNARIAKRENRLIADAGLKMIDNSKAEVSETEEIKPKQEEDE